jgi:hypothetical protein
MSGNAQWLDGGAGSAFWTGGACIRFPSGVAGIQIPTTAYNAKISNLELDGGDLFVSATLSTWEDWNNEATQLTGNSGLDGIQALGGYFTIDNVKVQGFKRHGLYVNGNSGGTPDNGYVHNFFANANRAYGIYTHGADANVAIYDHPNLRSNTLGAIKDSAFYGNTFINPHTTLNARDPGVAAGSNKTIAAANGLVVASNVLTITTTAAHGWAVNQWVTTTGSGDASYNGTCKLLTIPTTTTATCNFTHADGSTVNGTAATSSSTQVITYYTGNSIKFNAYVSTSTGGCSTFITPYAEANQTTQAWGCALIHNPQGLDNTSTGSQFFASTDGGTAGFLTVRTHGVIFTPTHGAGTGTFWQMRESTGTTNMVLIDPNTGAAQLAGKLRIRTPTSANDAFDGGIELPNGTTWAIKFRNNAGAANVSALYLDTSDIAHLSTPNGVKVDGSSIAPNTAAGADVGAALLPFSKLYFGTAATNNFVLTPAATTAARTVTINDPLANSTLRTEISGTATVDLASIATAACTADSADVTVTGARVGSTVNVTAATALEAGGFLIGRVTANDTARFQFCNLSGGAIDRASDTYTVRVSK